MDLRRLIYHVQQWWQDPSAPEHVEAKYLPRIDGVEPTEMLIIECPGRQRHSAKVKGATTATIGVIRASVVQLPTVEVHCCTTLDPSPLSSRPWDRHRPHVPLLPHCPRP